MPITISLPQVAAFLATLVVGVAGWSWLDPGKSKIQIVATIVLIEFVWILGSLVQRGRAKERDGWSHLRPGFALWLTFLACAPVSALLFLVYFGTDWQARGTPDQALPVLLMALGFGAGAIYVGLGIFATILRWDDEVIQQRNALLQVREIRWEDLRGGGVSHLMRQVWLRAQDGTTLRIPYDAHGMQAFLLRLGQEMDRQAEAAGFDGDGSDEDDHPVRDGRPL